MSGTPPRATWQLALDIAAGFIPAPPDSPPVRICGSRNDYDAWRRGYTYASRVLRGGRWEWVSPPASLGRFSAIDRYDVQYGVVYTGEVVAEYTMDGRREPDAWFLVSPHEVKGVHYDYLLMEGTRRRDGLWDLRWPGQQVVLLTVPDPYWL